MIEIRILRCLNILSHLADIDRRFQNGNYRGLEQTYQESVSLLQERLQLIDNQFIDDVANE